MSQIVKGIQCSLCGRDGVLKRYLPTKHKFGGFRDYFCSERCKSKRYSKILSIIGSIVLIISLFTDLVLESTIMVIFFYLVAFLLLGYAGNQWSEFQEYKVPPRIRFSSKSSKIKVKNETKKSISNNPDESAPQSIYVPELSKKIPLCCYQTARLGDRYCICGRVISQELHEIFIF